MRAGNKKRGKSIFRKTAVVFVIVALVPALIMGLRGYQSLADEMQHLVDSGKVKPAESAALLRSTEIQTFAYAGYGLAVALVLGYFFATSVVRPIRALQAGARRIGGGDLDFRVETDTEDELEELASTLNNMAISQKSREAEIKARSRELQVLYEISHTMAETRNQDKLLNSALASTIAISGATAGCVMLAGPDGKLKSAVCHASDKSVPAPSAAVFENAARQATRTGKTAVYKCPGSKAEPFHAIACVPLTFETRLRGALCLSSAEDHFSPEALRTISAIGGELVVAIENMVLFEEMEARTAELNQATEEIASLISEAESRKSFSTRYQNNNLVKCWEFKHCRFEQCPAYGSPNLRCWQIAGTHCGGEIQGVFAQKLGHCEKCEVLQRACPDKITLLGETFNNMMAILEQRVREQKELQRRLYSSLKLAAIGELAAGVAHEINNPLTGILASAMLLKSKTAAGRDVQKNLAVIESEALRARDIVRNLLDFAHQGDTIKTEAISLGSLIEQTLFLMRHQAKLASVKVQTRLDDGLPQLHLDANQMKQVFMNIIQNAVQAMPAGGSLVISATSSSGGRGAQSLQVEFADSGIGMDDEAMARIFDPFFTTKRIGEGTGLGLSVSHRIVSEHGGEIRVKSAPGRGSTFTVVLPVDNCQKEREVA